MHSDEGSALLLLFYTLFRLLEQLFKKYRSQASSFANGACELYEMLIIEEREM